jgi:hypothetical protein
MIPSSWTPWRVRWLGVILMLGLLTGCDGKNPLQGSAPGLARPAGPLWEEPQFSAMMNAYRQALPGKRRALEFDINTERARLQVQDPAKPENVDAYEYRNGQLSQPIPVHLMGGGKLEDNLFGWDEVAVDRIPELAKTAMEKVPLEGGKILQIKASRNLPFSDEVQIRVNLYGTRRSGYLKADAKGNVKETKSL